MYRSGDLARWRSDGSIEFVGRNDDQVKVRGFRVELGEINTRLAEYPGVREACVTLCEDASAGRRLVAHYIGERGLSAENLRAHLAASLPDHMLPAAYVRIEEWPLLPNGKRDLKALPVPDANAYIIRAYEPALDDVEECLCGLWSDLLGIGRIGRHDHFFELGGHSLLAVQLISRVRQSLGVEVALVEIFSRPRLADFARAGSGTSSP